MKKIVIILMLFSTYFSINSCSEIRFGDEFLGTSPEESLATIDTMFSTSYYANTVLTKAYTFLTYGIPTSDNNKLGSDVLESITDLAYGFNPNSTGATSLYNQGNLSPVMSSLLGSEAYRFGAESEYNTIRYAWFFIENVDKVPESEMTQSEKDKRVAEAKMLIAVSYFYMVRHVGGVPLFKKAIGVNDPIDFPRNTFAECIDYIVQLLDEAISSPDFPWSNSDVDDGRMTKAGAMALKLRVLLYAASPTFNSSTPWHSTSNAYTRYEDGHKNERWTAAKVAGEEFMNALTANGYYALIQAEEATHDARRKAFQKAYYDRGGTEILISVRKGYDVSTHSTHFLNHQFTGPTLNYVNMFDWADGTPFEWDYANESSSSAAVYQFNNPPVDKDPFFNDKGANRVPTRDPRLYETVAVAGDKWNDGTVLNPSIDINRPGATGFYVMKFVLQQASDRTGRPVQWPTLRLSEVLLSYAEVLNETSSTPPAEAFDLVDEVRARVFDGTDGNVDRSLNKAQFTELILKERAVELGFEEVRWHDLVRYGLEEDFKKTLYRLSSVGLGEDANDPENFTYEVGVLTNRAWANNWDSKWYLTPIPQVEINRNYGMTQNPGW